MKLKKILEISVSHNAKSSEIRVDRNGFICLTDMVKFFPKKSVKDWLKLKSTHELIKFLNGENSPYLKSIQTKKGRYNSGTFACEDLAIDFAMWLDPIFKLKLIRAYRSKSNFTEDWNRARIGSNLANRLIVEAIENVKDNPKSYHFSNEQKMLNKVVFGEHRNGIRDTASTEQLDLLNKLMSYDAGFAEIGLNYQERKELLSSIARPKAVNE